MRLKKIITSFVMMISALVIPFSSVFAGSYQYVGTHYTQYWSSTWNGSRTEIPAEYMGGDYMKICVGGSTADNYRVYEYDPNNADDFIGSKWLGGQYADCGEFYIGNQTDGDNNKAEIYVVASEYGAIDFYD
jgi:hypothetical protein